LEEEGIHVNMTLLFSIWQAAVAAENGATLISPFAGRITDFYKARDKVSGYEPPKDPGVISIKNIYNYYKKHGYKTVVMGASFRTKEQIIELAGCDLLTISPQLLDELAKTDAVVEKKLDASAAATAEGVPNKLDISQSRFLYEMNDDEMAHFKLAEGIRKFAQDTVKLEDEIVDLATWDAVRIAPGVKHGLEAGPDGAEFFAFGAPNTDNKDVEMVQDFWDD